MRWLLVAVFACSGPPRVAPVPPPPFVARPVARAPAPPPEPLAYLEGTLVTLSTRYLDPSRFDYRRMLRGALDGLEQEVPEVIAERTGDQITLRVNDAQQVFAGDVDSLAELGLRLDEMVRFIQVHKSPHTEGLEVELFAVNGMLRTLDPHTFVISAKEMEDWTVNLSGKFGGVGITIHMKNARVAVQKVYDNTPAARGGLEVGDTLVSINGQATEALTLDETMGRLRGDPGSAVKLVVERAGKQQDLSIVRAEIKLPVVEARMLEGKIGYLFIDTFAEETAVELERAMLRLKGQGARAWVIDLRQNPGGYLSQAVKAADQFVEYGTIVATVAGGKKHDIKNATSGGADPRAPVVVLVGEHTASAAEILAGALKQLDRAVLVGRRTFGKGSVQILEDAAHGAKLKITTAEYVAAHDISPQGDGIAPDVELVPAVVPTQIGDVGGELGIVRLAPEQPSRERDLGEALTTTQRPDPDKPRATITYRRVDVDDDPAKDFEVRFARDLAASTTARTRKELLRAVPRVVARARTIAERELVAAFAVLGIDWRPGHSRPTLAAKLDGEVRAQTGSLVTLRGEITNTGTVAAYRVLARASSADPALDGVELAFGMIAPRTTKQATAVVRLPRGATSRASTLTWRVEPTALEATTKVAIAGVPTPRFTLVARLADDNDGIARAGEPLRVRLRISNVGPGRAGKAIATLKSAVGERLLVDRGRLELGAIEPNQSKEVELVFAVKTGLDVPKIALDLVVADANVGASATQKLELALGARVADIKWELTPPKIRVDDVPLETTAEQLRITGSADDEQLVSDLYISTSNRAAKVQERKIFYKAGRASKLAFATDVPLAPGINRILITAREHDVSQTTRTLWVVRR